MRQTIASEVEAKLAIVHNSLLANDLAAIRLRGADWFAWLSCGGSSLVDTSFEAGVAELLITRSDAFVMADRIDTGRIRDEELGGRWQVVTVPWAVPDEREQAVRARVDSGRVASDRPHTGELPLPADLRLARLHLTLPEIDRYRTLCADAANAVTATLHAARPPMTEAALAALAARQAIERGMWPVVILVGGARRLPLYRHPTPRDDEPLGERAMLVICARRHGLIANLTRFVYFRQPLPDESDALAAVAEVEAAALDASTPGASLGDVYRAIARAYRRAGFEGAEADHHQGGLAGYRTREEFATPASTTVLSREMALAWNPSLPGAKIEDTFIVTDNGLETLTVDSDWPAAIVRGRPRPAVLLNV
jgi:Xaa-Pro aminopeptidase